MLDRFGREQSAFVIGDLDDLVPGSHPLREARVQSDHLLAQLGESNGQPLDPFDYSVIKLRFLLALVEFRNDGQVWDVIKHRLVYRWFVGLDPIADAASLPEDFASAWAGCLSTREVFESAWPRYEGGDLVRLFFANVLESSWLQALGADERLHIDYAQLRSLAG